MNKQEQMLRFSRACESFHWDQCAQMDKHVDKGGWDDVPMKDLTAGAFRHISYVHNHIPDLQEESLRQVYIENLADAANYLALVSDRIQRMV